MRFTMYYFQNMFFSKQIFWHKSASVVHYIPKEFLCHPIFGTESENFDPPEAGAGWGVQGEISWSINYNMTINFIGLR